MRFLVLAAAILAALPGGQTVPKDTRLLVKLNDSLDSRTSRPGQKIRAVVIAPVSLRGGRLEGVLEEVAQARLRFTFHTLRLPAQTVSVRTELTGVVNSKGNPGRDDLDQPVRIEQGAMISAGSATAIHEGAELRLVGEER